MKELNSNCSSSAVTTLRAKKERAVGLPKPTLATVFEVVTAGKVYRVTGVALQRWIARGMGRRDTCSVRDLLRHAQLGQRWLTCVHRGRIGPYGDHNMLSRVFASASP
jgi:hypothetical protein